MCSHKATRPATRLGAGAVCVAGVGGRGSAKGGRGEGGPPVRGTARAPAPLVPCSEAPVPCSSGREGGGSRRFGTGNTMHPMAPARATQCILKRDHEGRQYQWANAVKCTQANTVIYLVLLCCGGEGRSVAVGTPTGAARAERGRECSRGAAHGRHRRGGEGGEQWWDRPLAFQGEVEGRRAAVGRPTAAAKEGRGERGRGRGRGEGGPPVQGTVGAPAPLVP